MKVLVIGNCQARPLANILKDTRELEVTSPIILHLAREEDFAHHESLMTEADLIITQATTDTFEPANLRSSRIKARFGINVIVWPNLFFMGQTPNLRYLNHKDIGRILGPLDAYHDVGILREWLRSRFGTDHGLKELDSDAIATKSLSDLQIRESHCDVIISDLIQENYKSKKLFFTFNHPTIWLLEKIAERILAKAKIQVAIHPKFDNEPLGKIQPPDIFSIKNLSEARFLGVSNESKSKGCERLYSAESLKDAFFANYDGHREHLERFEKISFTPPY